MTVKSFLPVAPESHFPIQNLPYGVFRPRSGGSPRVGVALGESVVDLSALELHGLLGTSSLFDRPSLNAFMAAGPAAWRAARARLTELLTDPGHRAPVEAHLEPQAAVELRLPFEVGDYVDFYSSREHATTVGQIFRPGAAQPLAPAWMHQPTAYHGRAGSVVGSTGL